MSSLLQFDRKAHARLGRTQFISPTIFSLWDIRIQKQISQIASGRNHKNEVTISCFGNELPLHYIRSVTVRHTHQREKGEFSHRTCTVQSDLNWKSHHRGGMAGYTTRSQPFGPWGFLDKRINSPCLTSLSSSPPFLTRRDRSAITGHGSVTSEVSTSTLSPTRPSQKPRSVLFRESPCSPLV